MLESARWGDKRRNDPYTTAYWEAERGFLTETYFPARSATVRVNRCSSLWSLFVVKRCGSGSKLRVQCVTSLLHSSLRAMAWLQPTMPVSFTATSNRITFWSLMMAPEQHLAEPTDARTDQFSFCVALYWALYGEFPFAGGGHSQQLKPILAWLDERSEAGQ